MLPEDSIEDSKYQFSVRRYTYPAKVGIAEDLESLTADLLVNIGENPETQGLKRTRNE